MKVEESLLSFDDIYRLSESMTGAIIELCHLIKWPNISQINRMLSHIHTEEAARVAAHQLAEKTPDNEDRIFDIIMEETVEYDAHEQHWIDMANKKA
jgi:hypothetical protein